MSLSDCVFYFAGKPKTSKTELRKKILSNGGSTTKIFNKKVTHFVVLDGGNESPHYKTAQENAKMKFVTEEFILECREGKKRPNEEDFTPTFDEKEANKSTQDVEEGEEKKGEVNNHENDANKSTQDVEEGEEKKGEVNNHENDANKSTQDVEDEKSKVKETETASQKTGGNKKNRKTVPKSQRPPVEKISSVLKDWVVLLSRLKETSSHKNELTQFIESHGGRVVSTISPKVTHLVTEEEYNSLSQSKQFEDAKDSGVIIVDEDYLHWFVEDKLKKQGQTDESPVKKKGKKKHNIEGIISRRLIKGEPYYLVSYVGLPESSNEIIPRDKVQQGFGAKKLEKFDHDYEKEMKEVFSIDSLFSQKELKGSPIKMRTTTKSPTKKKTGKENAKPKPKASSLVTEKNDRISVKRTMPAKKN